MRGEKFKVQKTEDGCTADVYTPQHVFMLKKQNLPFKWISHSLRLMFSIEKSNEETWGGEESDSPPDIMAHNQ